MPREEEDEYDMSGEEEEEDEEVLDGEEGEEKEEGEEDEDDEEDEEAERGKASRKLKMEFQEELPEEKEAVHELNMLLPGKGPQKHKVIVNLSRPPRSFTKVYRKTLETVKRDNIIKRLAADPSALARFFEWEKRMKDEADEEGEENFEEEEEEEDEEEEVDEDGNVKRKAPYPYWLPSLVSNDAFFLERTCRTMYGWAVAPPPPPVVSFNSSKNKKDLLADNKKNARGAVSFKTADQEAYDDDEEEEGEEEDEDEEAEHVAEHDAEHEDGDEDAHPFAKDPARQPDSYFKQNGAFRGAAEGGNAAHEEGGGEASTSSLGLDPEMPGTAKFNDGQHSQRLHGEAHQQQHRTSILVARKQSSSNIVIQQQMGPLTSIPAFSDVNYPFYIVWDKSDEEWHLIDLHPLVFMHRKREEARNKQNKARGGQGEDDDEDDVKPSRRAQDDDDDEEGSEDDEEADDEAAEENDDEEDDEDGDDDVPDYDLDSIIHVDALILAALYSPALLRTALLQEKAPSFAGVQKWLDADLNVGFPVLSSIYVSLLSVRKDWARIPHRIPRMYIDYNLFFTREYVFSSATADHRLLGSHLNKSTDDVGKSLDDIASPRSADGMFTMKALLRAGIAPSKPISRSLLTSPESLQLALWLLMSMPKSLLLEWGQLALQPPADAAGASRGAQDGEEDDEDDDDYDDEENQESMTESVILEKIARDERKAKQLAAQQLAAEEANRAAEEYPPSGPAGPNSLISKDLLPAPLLLHAMLEIRRRVAREKSGKEPSIYLLGDALSKYYEASQVEDNKRLGDPLVTAHLELVADPPEEPQQQSAATVFATATAQQSTASESASGPPPPPVTLGTAMPTLGAGLLQSLAPPPTPVRHQRVFQTDMLLLLLVLTTTKLSNTQRPSLRTSSSFLVSHRNSNALPGGDGSTCVVVRRSSVRQSQSPDAHTALFVKFLRLKLDKVQTPLQRSRSATCRLLLLVMPRFKKHLAFMEVCEAMPLYQLLGPNERCPLGNLVASWAHEGKEMSHRYLDIFANTFWREIHLRMEAGLYPASTLEAIRGRLGAILDKTKERANLYKVAVASLHNAKRHGKGFGVITSPCSTTQSANFPNSRTTAVTSSSTHHPHEKSAPGSPGFCAADSTEPLCQALRNNQHAAHCGLVTLTHPSPHGNEVHKGEVYMHGLLDTLPMEPRTIYTPELLFSLLFRMRELDPIAVRYVMVNKGVSMVSEDGPFKSTEMPALEYAIGNQNALVAKLLVGIGAPLDDLVLNGALTMEALAERCLEPSDVAQLRELWILNERTVRTDPGDQFGVRRGVTDTPVA